MGQQRRLLQYVNYLIKSDLQDLFHIDIDQLGCRLQACGRRRIGKAVEGELRSVRLRYGISLFLKFEYLERFNTELTKIIYEIQTSNTNFQQGIHNALRAVVENSTYGNLTIVSFDYINHLFALHN
ncbi:hypothetical protein DPMN_021214 [Dreissena polymorpha]|uniref:Uncharacterized protein n=1 Tax=Dreissena polymorpha TaxID=45954 RepID=A0A9D4SAX0_DREPO|nr:hypothetical protein DPMN_021214 [Dreissena polymorpha]